MNNTQRGIVKWFDSAKGYGFAVNTDGEDVFIHYRSIQQDRYKNLKEGQDVSFVQVRSGRGW